MWDSPASQGECFLFIFHCDNNYMQCVLFEIYSSSCRLKTSEGGGIFVINISEHMSGLLPFILVIVSFEL